MEQLQLLWEYQKFDLLMDEKVSERKNSKLRRKLVKLKNNLMDLQDKLVKLDEEAEKKKQTLENIKVEYESLIQTITAGKEKVSRISIDEKDQLDIMQNEAVLLKEKIIRKEQDLSRLIKELNNIQKKVETTGQNISNSKKEYSKTKDAYDEKIKECKAEIKKLEEKRNAIAEKIEKTLLTRYNTLKANHTPVISLIEEDRCAGCNMSLASLVISNVKDKNRIIECENCGRLLFYNG